jgi:hypothetical protein
VIVLFLMVTLRLELSAESAPMETVRSPENEQPSTVAVMLADVAARMLTPSFPVLELLLVIEQLGP